MVAVTVWLIPGAADTVVCAPDDGWWYHPKYVEQLPDINKLCNVASCWIYIRIFPVLLSAHKSSVLLSESFQANSRKIFRSGRKTMNPQYVNFTYMTVFHIKLTVDGNVSCRASKCSIFAKYTKCFVEALRHKPEGRGFDSRWCHWNFSLA